MQTLTLTPQYKTYFPTDWILSTAESRAAESFVQGNATEAPSTSRPTADIPPDIFKESLPPTALFIQQAGLATPTTSTNTADHASEKRKRIIIENNSSSRQNTSHEGMGSITTNKAAKSRPDAKSPHIRRMMKKLFPKSKPDKSLLKEKPASAKVEKHARPASPSNTISQATPVQRAQFQWPNSPVVPQQATSQFDMVQGGSQNQLTADNLGMTAPETNLHGTNQETDSLTVPYSAEPMTASTGISSRSSNYADIPSRLPRFPNGYSPMS